MNRQQGRQRVRRDSAPVAASSSGSEITPSRVGTSLTLIIVVKGVATTRDATLHEFDADQSFKRAALFDMQQGVAPNKVAILVELDRLAAPHF